MSKIVRCAFASVISFAVGAFAAHSVCAQQDYPNRPIRMLTSEVGSGSDVVGRFVAELLPNKIGQRGIVDNRGILAPEIVAKAAPDGYTIVMYSTPLWVAPMLRDNVPWDPIKSFTPVTLGVNTPNVLVVHPSVPVHSIKEFIALARAKPGVLNYGSGSSGSTSHLAAELFNDMANVKTVRVPYKGVGPATIGLVSGEVHFIFATGSTIAPQIKNGRVRALGVSSLKPSALFPGLPTMASQGLPGYETGTPMGVFAPAGTPPAIVHKLSQAFSAVLQTEDVKQRVFSAGAEVVAMTPEEFAAYLKNDIAKWTRLVKLRGIHE